MKTTDEIKMEDKTRLDLEKADDSNPDISRQNLIEKAIKFLENPKVKHSPLSQKRTFLASKGLTPIEIDLAIERSGTTTQDANQMQVNLPVGQEFGPIATPPHTVLSPWSVFRDYCQTGALICAALYGLYHLSKKYVIPYLFGAPSKTKKLNQLEAQLLDFQTTMYKNMVELQETLQVVQSNIQQLNKKQDSIVVTQASQGMPASIEAQFSDLKQELVSLKGLLLNRHQFPATPSITPIIPTWQMSSKPEVNAETTDIVDETASVNAHPDDDNANTAS